MIINENSRYISYNISIIFIIFLLFIYLLIYSIRISGAIFIEYENGIIGIIFSRNK